MCCFDRLLLLIVIPAKTVALDMLFDICFVSVQGVNWNFIKCTLWIFLYVYLYGLVFGLHMARGTAAS